MKTLTSWRILQYTPVIVVSGNNFKFSFGNRLAARVTCEYFYFASIVLARLGNIQMVHAIVCQLVTRSISNSMAVNQPHHSRSGMASHTATVPGPFAFFNCARLRFADKHWRLFRFSFLIGFIRGPGDIKNVTFTL